MATAITITTADQLFQAPGLGRCELIRGNLVMMSPAGFRHGRVVSTVNRILGVYASDHGLGVVTGAETGFQIGCNPDTVRAPDIGFVRTERLPETEPVGFFQGAPDLAVEILSPSDRASEVLQKVQDWLGAGCRAVWIVDPETRTVSVYHGRHDAAVMTADQSLDGGQILPGLRLNVGDIFA
jgi:Uma2 family endonuclease